MSRLDEMDAIREFVSWLGVQGLEIHEPAPRGQMVAVDENYLLDEYAKVIGEQS